jgi:hypothetical protein
MDVEVDDGDSFDARGLQNTSSHRDVVEWAEAFAVIGKRMVQAAADVNRRRDMIVGTDQPA